MLDVDVSKNKGISEKKLTRKKYLSMLKLYVSKDFKAAFSLDKKRRQLIIIDNHSHSMSISN